jgi:hypothetical protein
MDTPETATVEVTQCMTKRQKQWATRYARYGESGLKPRPRSEPVKPAPDRMLHSRPIPPLGPDDIARFWAEVEKTDNCWNWRRSVSGNATHRYGDFRCAGKSYRAHRISYHIAHGGIPDGMVIDHLCRNVRCVNPAHLEAVTSGENTRRGLSFPTHCKRGHVLSGSNVRLVGHQRRCRACQRIRTQKCREKKNG